MHGGPKSHIVPRSAHALRRIYLSLTISTLKRGNLVLSANQVYKLGALSTKRLVNKAVNEAASLKVAHTRVYMLAAARAALRPGSAAA